MFNVPSFKVPRSKFQGQSSKVPRSSEARCAQIGSKVPRSKVRSSKVQEVFNLHTKFGVKIADGVASGKPIPTRDLDDPKTITTQNLKCPEAIPTPDLDDPKTISTQNLESRSVPHAHPHTRFG
jgi:hypothetical protein